MKAKRAENFQGLEINFGKVLLVYFVRAPPQTLCNGDQGYKHILFFLVRRHGARNKTLLCDNHHDAD